MNEAHGIGSTGNVSLINPNVTYGTMCVIKISVEVQDPNVDSSSEQEKEHALGIERHLREANQ